MSLRSVLRVTAVTAGLLSLAIAVSASAQSGKDDGGGHAQAGAAGLAKSSVKAFAAPGALGAPAGFSVLGVDVSSHDHSLYPIDWGAVAASGTNFAYVKATEGKSYANPYFAADNTNAKNVGLLTGAYAFARPDLRDPVGEANYFIDHAQWADDARTLVPFVDLEWPYASLQLPACYGLAPAEMVTYVHALLDQIQVRTGRKAMIYTNANWWNPCVGNDTSFGGYPLDLASWTAAPPTVLPSGWSKYTVWQYSGGNNSQAGNYDKDAFNGGYAALTALAGAAPAAEAPFELRAHADNRYVTADQGGNSPLIANRDVVGAWERFDLVDAGGGDVALRAHANGRYVTADNAGASALVANRTEIGAWERFKLVTNADGSISFKAEINGKYVTAESFGTQPLIANRDGIGNWEEFDKVPVPAVISFKANANGQYVSADGAGRSPLIANRSAVGTWEQYDLLDLGGGKVALVSHANNMYVSAANGGTTALIANRPAVGLWETFTLVTNDDGSFSLRAAVNGQYVTAEAGGAAPLIANRPAVGAWERFTRVGVTS